MFFIRKPERVEAFKFTDDVERTAPAWFDQLVQKEKIYIDRIMTDGSVRIYGCTIATSSGKAKAKIGDYVIRDSAGEVYVCKKKDFQRQFEKEGGKKNALHN